MFTSTHLFSFMQFPRFTTLATLHGTAHTYIPSVPGHATNIHSGASLVGVSTKPGIHNGWLINMPRRLYNISWA